ncbi:hypothetical protein K2P97_01535 [bacterium]|nr:hypothetical protein [bacterium]
MNISKLVRTVKVICQIGKCLKSQISILTILVAGLVCSKSTYALEMSVVGPCDQQPKLEVYVDIKDKEEVTLGDLTVKVLNSRGVPFKGDASGIAQIYDSPLGDEAIEVLSPSILRAYGWCVHVDNDEPAEMPDKVVITSQVSKITWFYAYSLYDKGEWKDYCTPSWKVRSLNYCQKPQSNK